VYTYAHPTPIVIHLNDDQGFAYREQAAEFVSETKVRGREAGNSLEQSYGKLAEIAIRNLLNLPEAENLGHDLLLPTGIKVDVKCRSGKYPFQENYVGTGDIPRESKHNLYTRQIMDERFDTDVYLMTNLQTPATKNSLPGTKRQKTWNLSICGWISKQRVLKEAVNLPRGSLSERSTSWFPYRDNNTEIYNKNLNGLTDLQEILSLDQNDIDIDSQKSIGLNLTSIDALRIASDMYAKGLISSETVIQLQTKFGINNTPPFFHQNQYNHLGEWLQSQGIISDEVLRTIDERMPKVPYEVES
jgi:hypothetical protein